MRTSTIILIVVLIISPISGALGLIFKKFILLGSAVLIFGIGLGIASGVYSAEKRKEHNK